MNASNKSLDSRFTTRAVRGFTFRIPAAEIYAFIHDASNLEEFLHPPMSVEAITNGGFQFQLLVDPVDSDRIWTLNLLSELPDQGFEFELSDEKEAIASGRLTLTPAPGEGTEVAVALNYTPSGGKLSEWFGKHLPNGLPEQLHEQLRRLKALLEAGEIPSTEGQPTGKENQT